MRGIYLRLKKVYIYTFKNTVFFSMWMRRIFLLSFWLLSADTDFELRKTFFHNFWNVYISLVDRFSELLKFPLPAVKIRNRNRINRHPGSALHMYFLFLERFALKKLLTDLAGVLDISVLTTDRSPSIKSLMRWKFCYEIRILSSDADPDPGTGAFLTPLFCYFDLGSGIRDSGSGMGKNHDPGSLINIPDPPRHWSLA